MKAVPVYDNENLYEFVIDLTGNIIHAEVRHDNCSTRAQPLELKDIPQNVLEKLQTQIARHRYE